MKIGGVSVSRSEEILVLPRINGDLVFRACAVMSMDDFDALCPKPEPPTRITKDGREPDYDSKNFMSVMKSWSERRYAYICVKSLEPSNIEWTNVDLEKPATWPNWIDELQEAGIASTELNRVQNLILEANALNEAKLKEARDAFLRGQGNQA
ncbi:MAG: hypothetical protein GY906_04670 [bacterium]|nr:hypothetical protein [bacterium]